MTQPHGPSDNSTNFDDIDDFGAEDAPSRTPEENNVDRAPRRGGDRRVVRAAAFAAVICGVAFIAIYGGTLATYSPVEAPTGKPIDIAIPPGPTTDTTPLAVALFENRIIEPISGSPMPRTQLSSPTPMMLPTSANATTMAMKVPGLRRLVLRSKTSGWVLDESGMLHGFGGAVDISQCKHSPTSASDPQRNAADVVVMNRTSATNKYDGYVLYGTGFICPFGKATTPFLEDVRNWWPGSATQAKRIRVSANRDFAYLLNARGSLYPIRLPKISDVGYIDASGKFIVSTTLPKKTPYTNARYFNYPTETTTATDFVLRKDGLGGYVIADDGKVYPFAFLPIGKTATVQTGAATSVERKILPPPLWDDAFIGHEAISDLGMIPSAMAMDDDGKYVVTTGSTSNQNRILSVPAAKWVDLRCVKVFLTGVPPGCHMTSLSDGGAVKTIDWYDGFRLVMPDDQPVPLTTQGSTPLASGQKTAVQLGGRYSLYILSDDGAVRLCKSSDCSNLIATATNGTVPSVSTYKGFDQDDTGPLVGIRANASGKIEYTATNPPTQIQAAGGSPIVATAEYESAIPGDDRTLVLRADGTLTSVAVNGISPLSVKFVDAVPAGRPVDLTLLHNDGSSSPSASSYSAYTDDNSGGYVLYSSGGVRRFLFSSGNTAPPKVPSAPPTTVLGGYTSIAVDDFNVPSVLRADGAVVRLQISTNTVTGGGILQIKPSTGGGTNWAGPEPLPGPSPSLAGH